MNDLHPRSGTLEAGSVGAQRALVIGLVNNMPDAALEATERQFHSLLTAAAGARPFVLRLIAIEEVPRSAAGRAHVERHYEDVRAIAGGGIDGLIVTGTEPRTPRLQDEPYWPALESAIDAARRESLSTIMSCLAAHAAVLAMDGVERRRLPDKLHGIFDCPAEVEHPLTVGLRQQRRVPHSRFNDLPQDALEAAGYQILARAGAVGADLFIKEGRSLVVFLQGHPEYDRLALMREYRRDVGRYLSGERESYPQLPQNYFDEPTAALLRAFEAHRVAARRDSALIAQFPQIDDGCPPESAWRGQSVQFYANWLALLEQRRAQSIEAADGVDARRTRR